MNLYLDRKVALVTGSAQGLGRAIAQSLAVEGCTVIIADLNTETADATALELRQSGLEAHSTELDVTDITDVVSKVNGVSRDVGFIDVLVNNAGVLTTGEFVTSSAQDWEQVSKVNLGGVYNCCRAVLPSMIENKRGKIINIASVSAERGGGAIGNVLYGSTKAGVVAMTKGLSREVAPFGVSVNAISPSVVETTMTRTQLTKEVRERVVSAIPMGRLGTGSEVGSLAAFLASDVASFVTGQIIAVDGGFLNA